MNDPGFSIVRHRSIWRQCTAFFYLVNRSILTPKAHRRRAEGAEEALSASVYANATELTEYATS